MPIPFREAEDVGELGEAGFLKIDQCAAGSHYAGALLLINARGEPVEFTYSRIEVPHDALWRPGDARRFATRQLAVSLLSLCPKLPRMLVGLAGDVEPELFSRDVRVSLPVCLVTATADAADVSWIAERPAEDSAAARLLQELLIRKLLVEPFERASRGLGEVYAPVASAGA